MMKNERAIDRHHDLPLHKFKSKSSISEKQAAGRAKRAKKEPQVVDLIEVK